jgi:hypothetical protein
MDGRHLLDWLATTRRQGAPIEAAESNWSAGSFQEIERLFDALLGAEVHPDRLDALRELLDNDSAYRVYPQAEFPRLNHLRELLLELP